MLRKQEAVKLGEQCVKTTLLTNQGKESESAGGGEKNNALFWCLHTCIHLCVGAFYLLGAIIHHFQLDMCCKHAKKQSLSRAGCFQRKNLHWLQMANGPYFTHGCFNAVSLCSAIWYILLLTS